MKKELVCLLFCLVLTRPLDVLAADPLDLWRWRNPLPNGKTLGDLTFGDGRFIAVGDTGTVAISTDGTNWAEFVSPPMVNPPGARYDFGGVCYGEGRFVAVGIGRLVPTEGSFGVITSSADGTNWMAPKKIAGAYGATAVTWGNGIFAAVAVSATEFEPVQTIVLTSADGSQWTRHELHVPKRAYAITYGNGRFVMVGEKGLILSSTNGVDWIDRSLDPPNELWGISFGNGLFVAVGQRTIATSADAQAWTRQATNMTFMGKSVIYGENKFVAVGDGGFTSTNGTNWSRITSGMTTTSLGLSSIAYGNGTFVALGLGSLSTSPNGVNWSSLGSQAVPFESFFEDVVYGNGRFVAVGPSIADTNYIVTSETGVSWTKSQPFPYISFSGVGFGNGTFLAVGSAGLIFASTNGVDWLSQQTGLTAGLNAAAYGNSRFVVVGSAGTILVRTNAADWVSPKIGLVNDLTAICFGQNLFVVGGVNGILLTTTNGFKWDFQSSGIEDPIMGLAYGNGTFIATTFDKVFTSTNGIDWAHSFSGAGFRAGHVRFGHGTFVTVTGDTVNAGSIWTSTNGVNWVKRNCPSTNPLGGVAFGQNTFLAVGHWGTILQSDPLPPGELVLGPIVPLGPNGVYRITGRGTPGENWQIQTSRDLVQWEPLLDLFNPDPVFEFVDQPPPDEHQRFYRALGR